MTPPRRALVLVALLSLGASRPKVSEWLVPEAPTTLHPLLAATPTDAAVGRLIHARVFEPGPRGFESRVFGEPTVVDRVVSLAALPEARWSDGQPVVGADLCATVDRLRDRSHPTRWTAGVVARIESCRSDPAHPAAAALTLTEPLADPRSALDFPLLPAHRPDWTSFAGGPEPAALLPIGAGPWTIKVREGVLSLTPPGAGALPAMLAPVSDPVREFLGGRGDRVDVAIADLPALRARPDVQVDRVRPGETWALFLDTSRPPFDDPEVRRAADLALDRAALASAFLGRDPELATQPWTLVSGPFPAGSPLASSGVPVPLPDPEALAGRGPLAIEVLVPAGAGAFLEALGAAWPGLKVTGRELTAEQWAFSLLDGGHLSGEALGAGESNAALVRLDEEPCAYLHTRTDHRGFANPFGFSDPGVDEACAALLAGDLEAGPRLHGRVADARPALFLWTVEGRTARRVR